ncbi:hypothetical protein J25TS5_30800 [Paenibacillus faecis]|uniref:hypothetical protein n=1 Tax=Paenibacillus faecis TaxID=862114 RepID=UPI001B0C6321|nr:hypothetical protein [Paenibacillus faecis]GIO86148.1 hypothetical protein J25TS5_30800 [Paenibacillus faecis]
MNQEIINRFKHFMNEGSPVFNSYVMRKASGEILDFDLLPQEDLKEMFIDENIIDNILAGLFDTDRNNVRKKRYKYNIKLGQTLSRKSEQKFQKLIDDYLQVSEESQGIGHVLIPIKIFFNPEDDLILAPYRVLENDGRPYPFYDQEGLQEIDTEAFCIRISKIKKEIRKLLRDITDFLEEYEWKEEVYFEWKDEKVTISAILYKEKDTNLDKISLAVSLQISGLHSLGDLIFDSVYDLHNNTLNIVTRNCDFETDTEEIYGIFKDSWDDVRRFVQTQKEIESNFEEEP